MTVISYDLKSVAIDRAGTYGDVMVETQKWHRMNDGAIILVCGSDPTARLLMALYDEGKLFECWPAAEQTDPDRRATLIRIYKRQVDTLFHSPIWIRQKYKMAWGSGSACAYGALMAGASAKRATQISAKHSTFCGLGVDVFPVR